MFRTDGEVAELHGHRLLHEYQRDPDTLPPAIRAVYDTLTGVAEQALIHGTSADVPADDDMPAMPHGYYCP